MPKRGEHIHKRKDGRWEGRYKNGVNDYGKTVYLSVYGKTYSEVKGKLNLIIQKEKLQHNPIGRERTLKEVILLWMDANKIKHKGATETKYENLIEKHILPELGSLRISSVTTFRLNDFMEKKLESGRLDNKGGLSASYVRMIMLIITSALQFAVNEQMCQPLKTPIHKPSPQKHELPILCVAEQKKLEFQLVHEINNTKLGILLSLHTGLRIGEVCALTWNDIDFENRIIHVRSTVARIKDHTGENATKLVIDKPKTKSSMRDIPISEQLFPLLKSLYNQAVSSYVISNHSGFVSPRTYEYRYHKILDESGVSQINYHALRHTFATRCIEVGVDVKTLSEILGHANVSITLNTYVHSSMDLKRTQLEKLSTLAI